METLKHKSTFRISPKFVIWLALFLCVTGGLILMFEPRDVLVAAARDGDIVTVKMLVFLGVAPSQVGWEEHFTPLGAAAYAGRTKAVRYLIAHGADIQRRDDNKRTALHWAKEGNQSYIVALLKQAGATE